MHSLSKPTLASAALAAIAALPAVSAHGYISGVVSGGTWYKATDPNWVYQSSKPQQAGWFAYDQDLGFVSPSAYQTENITCHNGATAGTTSVPVTAGDSIDLQWTVWPESHHGPVITYLAPCGGDCSSASASSLSFFKIDEAGLIDDSSVPGTWASDQLISNNNTWTLAIPSSLRGSFVLRNEIIALHSAGNEDGAQNYPMCINLEITGGSDSTGGSGTAGTALYKADDPGILVNIYESLSSYEIPGPALWTASKKRADLREDWVCEAVGCGSKKRAAKFVA